jgi:hypothetical protein
MNEQNQGGNKQNVIPSDVIRKRREYSMDDLLDIESSSQRQNQDLPSTEPRLYDEAGYDDNNVWESFLEISAEPVDKKENRLSDKLKDDVAFPEDVKSDQDDIFNVKNDEISNQPVNVSQVGPTSTLKKNEIRDLLMDLF